MGALRCTRWGEEINIQKSIRKLVAAITTCSRRLGLCADAAGESFAEDLRAGLQPLSDQQTLPPGVEVDVEGLVLRLQFGDSLNRSSSPRGEPKCEILELARASATPKGEMDAAGS